MDEVTRRLEALEYEVKRLRSKVRKENLNSGLTLDSAIQVQSLPGERTKDVFFGYEGPLYKDIASDLTGLSTATDPFTRIQSTVNNTDRDALLQLIAAEPDGTVIQEYAEVDIVRDSGSGNLVRLIAANSSDVGVYRFYPNGTATVEVDGGGESEIIDEVNTEWIDLTDGGATTLHSHALGTRTPTYYKSVSTGTGPSATTSETTLGSFTVTGGDMGTTGILRVHASGTCTGAGASTTFTFRVKFGGSTLATLTTAADTNVNVWHLEWEMANINDAAIQRCIGHLTVGQEAATTDELLADTPVQDSSSIDTASNRTFEITGQLSSGTSPNSLVRMILTAELL